MSRMTGRAGVVSISDGGALAADPSLDLRSWRVPALLVGAVLACIAALTLATLPSVTAPSTRPLALRHGLQSHSATRLPISLAPAASAAIGASDRSFWPVRHGASLLAQGGGIHSTFNASGAALRVAEGTLGLSLVGVGRGQSLDSVAAAAPTSAANQVLYKHGSIAEVYRNGPYGLEQGFSVQHRPQGGTGPLGLVLHLGGSLVAEQVGSQILLRTHTGTTALRYGELSAVDATGRVLPAHMQLGSGTLRLVIDDSRARYPLRIDPFVQQGPEITGLGPSCGYHLAALSGDGNTALLGNLCTNERAGAAWVFTRSGSTWTEQAELVPTDRVGAAEFGEDVALSYDGNTALVGGERDRSGHGAAWVFTRSGSTWTQQGPKFAGGANEKCGVSVGLSSDGNTALMACHGGSQGVYFFTRSGSTWMQQGPEIAVSVDLAAALSGDGNTALLTAGQKATVLVRSGSTWSQQGSSLSVPGTSRGGAALAADGNTGLAGGSVIVRSDTTWTVQQQLTSEQQGEALSANGNLALIGSSSGPLVFVRSGSTWTQTEELTGEGSSFVALSASGSTALTGDATGWRVFVSGPAAPAVLTETASAVTQTVATLNASVNPEGQTVTDCHFEYGPTTSYGSSVPCSTLPGGGESAVAVSASLAGLSANTAYHFRIVATNATGTSEGSDETLTTPPYPPVAVTEPASAVAAATAVLNATVNPNGGAVSECEFEYGPTMAYGSSVPCSSLPGSGESPVVVSAAVTGLSSNTAYHFRVITTNAGGTSYGGDQAFTTLLSPPAVATEPASSVTQTVATLNASVNPEGQTVTDCHFEYGPTTSYGSSVPCSTLPGGGESAVAVSASLAGLSANTAYHFRIVATNATGTSEGSDETFTTPPNPPTVTSVSPEEGPQAGGTTVTITGTNFNEVTAVKFGSANATSFTVNSESSITAESPAGTGLVDLTVTTPEGTSATGSAGQFSYLMPPTVTKIKPNKGPVTGGTSVTVTGTNFSGATAVKFGSISATSFTVNAATSITAVSPAGTGTVDVTVTMPGGTSATSSADQFSYLPPTVAKLKPNKGPEAGGTTVTITGTNFSGATAVKFGSANATSFTVNSATSITAVSPAGTGTVDVTVSTPSGTSATKLADQFSYLPPPTVTGVSPEEGPQAGGTSVSITGTNLTGATAVKFGSAKAKSFTVNSESSITAVSPVGTGTVDVALTTPGGTSATSSADQFSYLPPPTVTGVSPKEGPVAGGTEVTITGTNLSEATAVKFGSASVTIFTVNLDGSITAASPAETAGTVNVTVTTPNGTSAISTADRFNFVPIVTGLSPNAGSKASGTTVTVSGTGFALGTSATIFKFGSTNATSVNCTSTTECTVVSPAHAVGTVDVKATVNKVSSPKVPADQFTYN